MFPNRYGKTDFNGDGFDDIGIVVNSTFFILYGGRNLNNIDFTTSS